LNTYPTPTKPKESYTLGELESFQQDIIHWARVEKVFDKILTIGRELAAASVKGRFDTYLISVFHHNALPITPITVVYHEYTGRLLSQTIPATWETIEQVTVYLGPAGATLEAVTALDGSGNPKFYLGLQVLNYQKSTHPTGNEKTFIAPGRWVDVILDQYDQAEIERRAAILAAENAARDRLYAEMLLDKDL
jgi:hypothetical protein